MSRLWLLVCTCLLARLWGGQAFRVSSGVTAGGRSGGSGKKAVMLHRIREALSRIEYPSKKRLARAATKLGHKYEPSLSGYSYLHRGDLFSPFAGGVADMNLVFNRKESAEVSLPDYIALEGVADKIFGGADNIAGAKISLHGEKKFDGPVEDLDAVRSSVEQGADSAVLTGRFRTDMGWSMPMDLELEVGPYDMSKAKRFKLILDDLDEGDYGKAVSRLRRILPSDQKLGFGLGWSNFGGQYHFLVNQLGLLNSMSPSEAAEYMEKRLHLPSNTPHEEWKLLAEEEMQRRGLSYLFSRRQIYEEAIRGLGPDILGKLEALRDSQFGAGDPLPETPDALRDSLPRTGD